MLSVLAGKDCIGERKQGVMCQYRKRSIPFFIMLCVVCWTSSSADATGVQTYTFGSARYPWRIFGSLSDVAYNPAEGWIAPRVISPDENLSLSATARGGMAWSFWGDTWTSGVVGWGRTRRWRGSPQERIIDGDPTTVYEQDFERWGGARTGMLLVDLGGAFAVHRIRLHPPPRTRGGTPLAGILDLTVSINDGGLGNRDGMGRPLLTPVWGGQADAGADVDVTFPEEAVRYVGVWVDAVLADAFALVELEVYGSGYVPRGSYTSRIIDFKDIVALGEIGWRGERVSNAEVRIRTRSGMDEEPNIYWRKVKEGQLEKLTYKREDGEPLTKEDYEKLLSDDRGPITYDTNNWSFWSAPYDFEEGLSEGVPIVSPSPQQYFQIQVEFVSTPTEGARIDSLWFEYSHPPCAHEIIGEIHPIEVKPAEMTTFTYAVRPRILGEDTGFDTMEIRTPVPTEEIREMRIDRVPAPFTMMTKEVSEGGFRNPQSAIRNREGFVVSFRKIEVDRTLVEVVFDSQVLRYSTEFVGRVWNSEIEQVPQRIFPGDADERVASDDLAVRLPLKEPLIVSVDVTPNPFTPNGDGINDETRICYSLLHLTAPTSVEVEIYALSGRTLRTLYAGQDINGNYVWMWDGKDDNGSMVTPGIYVYRIRVDADTGKETWMGTVSVAY